MFNTIFSQDKYMELDMNKPQKISDLNNFFGDTTLNQYSVFFTGENHAFAETNVDLELKFLIYLNKNYGVQHFLFEQSPAVGYLISKIIVDDDIDCRYYLKDKFYDPFFRLVNNIRKYNDTLDRDKRIIAHGIDIERFPAFSIYALNDITDSLSTKGATGKIYETIRALWTSEFKDAGTDEIYNEGGTKFNLTGDVLDAWPTIKTIMYDSNLLKDSLEIELGDYFNVYFEILDGLQKGYDWYHSERKGDLGAPVLRERFMLDQFLRISKQYPNAKFYGQFGRCHLHAKKTAKRCYSYDMNSIASRINELDDSLYKGKVLSIPVYYSQARAFDGNAIRSLNLNPRFTHGESIYILDMDYIRNDNPLVGFGQDLPYVIINSYSPGGYTDMFSFNYTLEQYHLGIDFGYRYFNKLSRLNNALDDLGSNRFTNKFEFITVGGDYIVMKDIGYHISYSFMPNVMNNGDKFSIKGQYFTFGNYYPFGNKFFMGAFGLNYSYGNVTLSERIDIDEPSLIQIDGFNVTTYRNDIFFIDPNVQFRITLPVISLNFKAGYSFDVSGKYWRLDGKMKNFTKTSFSSPYVQAGISLNFKNEY